MKKGFLIMALLTLSLSSSANVITCTGEMSDTTIVLDLTGKGTLLKRAEYLFENNIVPTSGHEFRIQADDQDQELTYKFRTLKRHGIVKKNVNLILTINQRNLTRDAYKFTLNVSHNAVLKVDLNGSVATIDRLSCEQVKQ
jgi:hypothetical protein